MNQLYFIASMLAIILSSIPAKAKTYYVSLTGKDSNSGTSVTNAWGSIEKVNATHFLPGDSILFEGGSIFSGGIFIGASEKGQLSPINGTAKDPIVFSSYGTGRATISSGKIAGFKAYNAAGIKVEKLIFSGAGSTVNESFGVEFYMDVPDTLLEFICVDNVEVFGYREAGIAIASWDQITGGYKDVSITNSSSHDNGDAGIVAYAQGKNIVHKNIYVGYCKSYNNSGLPDKWWNHSGSGITLGGISGALIEYCESYNNGWLNNYRDSGPIGIWGYNCNNLLIQFNESYYNKTNSVTDGGGFDLDGGCINCTLQYNYSHDNDGAGYVIAQYVNAPPMKAIVVRYNISENDARKNTYGSILIWSSGASGGIAEAEIYNNTFFITPSNSKNGPPNAIWLSVDSTNKVNIRNNIFVTAGNVRLINKLRYSNVRFEQNNYWSLTKDFFILWEGKSYSSLEEWREATGQETLNGKPTGYSIDPELKDPGKGVTIGDPTKLYTLTGYELKESSGLIGKGLDLKKEFGIDIGKYDYFGNSLEGLEEFSIGAYQLVKTAPLPVTFASFTATRQAEAALLEWETASERNSRGFGVEVSLNGTAFRPLGFVASKTPNSNQIQRYNYLDTELGKAGTRYYRLRQVDLDGKATYSEVKALAFDEETVAGLRAFPNPFTKDLTLEVTAEKEELLNITITDPLGRIVLESAQNLKTGKNTMTLKLSDKYPRGFYLLKAQHGVKTYQLKLVRQ
ncbi:T9SS type A sorting domain-containing protein [Pontibacter ruber]|uniref:T9SS type A sorting domain-containing protein n=1 Tax=Pontibacter ruber TaxID=1343895 RepID=A0ABW5D2W8_9BACT|nr:T9SS type A sorting domain-containing protein [Pontibacter ruber]